MDQKQMQFETLLLYLGKDIEYMGLRVQKDVQKCIKDLNATHDNKKFSSKLTEILKKFFEYTVQYSQDLENRIKDFSKEDEYKEIVNKLKEISRSKLKIETDTCTTSGQKGAETSNSLGPPNNNAGENSVDLADHIKDEVLSQYSVHISGTGDEIKSEDQSAPETSGIQNDDLPSNDLVDLVPKESLPTPSNLNDSSATIFYSDINSSNIDNKDIGNQNNDIAEQQAENPGFETFENDNINANSLEISHSEEVASAEDEDEVILSLPDAETIPEIVNTDKSKDFPSRNDILNTETLSSKLEKESEFLTFDEAPPKVIPLPYRSLFEEEKDVRNSSKSDADSVAAISISKEEEAMVSSNVTGSVVQSKSVNLSQDVTKLPADNISVKEKTTDFSKNQTNDEDFDSDVEIVSVTSSREDDVLKTPQNSGSEKGTVSNCTEESDSSDVEIIEGTSTQEANVYSQETVANSPETPKKQNNGENDDLNEVAAESKPSQIDITSSPKKANIAEAFPDVGNNWDAKTVANDSPRKVDNVPRLIDSDEDTVFNSPESQNRDARLEDAEEVVESDIETIANTPPRSDNAAVLQQNGSEQNAEINYDSDADTVAYGSPRRRDNLVNVRDRDSDQETVANSSRETLDDAALPNSDEITVANSTQMASSENDSDSVANLTRSLDEEDSDSVIVTSTVNQAELNREENCDNANLTITEDKKQNSDSDDSIYLKATQKTATSSQKLNSDNDDTDSDVDFAAPTQFVARNSIQSIDTDNSEKTSSDLDDVPKNIETNDNNGDLIGLTESKTSDAAEELHNENVGLEDGSTRDFEISQNASTKNGAGVKEKESDIESQESYVFDLGNEEEIHEVNDTDSCSEIAEVSVASPKNEKDIKSGEAKDDDSSSISEIESASSDDNDIDGDISESDNENAKHTKGQPKKKLKEKDRKSLLKVIADFFMKRKREKAAAAKESKESSIKKTEHHKKSTRKNKHIEEHKKKKPAKQSDVKVKTRKEKKMSSSDKGDNEAGKYLDFVKASHINESSGNSSDEFARDNMDIQEYSSDSVIDATQIENVDIATDTNKKGNKSKIGDSDNSEEILAPSKKSSEPLQPSVTGGSVQSFSDFINQLPLGPNEDSSENDKEDSGKKLNENQYDEDARSENDGNNDGQVVSPFKKKSVKPLKSSDEEESDGTKTEEDSQVISSYKKKGIKRLRSSDESESEPPKKISDTQDDQESQIVKPFKRVGVKRLLSSEEELDASQKTSKKDESEKWHLPKRRKAQRLLSSEQSSPDELDSDQNKKKESDEDGNDVEEEEDRGTSEENSPDTEPSQFKLDDKARDDFLELLGEYSKSRNNLDNSSAEEREENNENGENFHFKLGDSDRDNLLNLLTNKENDDCIEVDKVQPGESRRQEGNIETENTDENREIEASQFNLNSKARDEFLKMLSSDTRTERNEENKDTDTSMNTLNKNTVDLNDKSNDDDDEHIEPSQFKLNDKARDAFLEMLSGKPSGDLKAEHKKQDQNVSEKMENITGGGLNEKNKVSKEKKDDGVKEIEPSRFVLDDSARDEDKIAKVDNGPIDPNKDTLSSNSKENDVDSEKDDDEEKEISDKGAIDGTVTENSQGIDDIDSVGDTANVATTDQKIEEKNHNGDKASEFKLDEEEQEELLNVLSDYIKNREGDDTESNSSDSASDLESDDNKRHERKRKSKRIDKGMLLELVQEYENAVARKDSSSESVLLDILREESVEQDGGRKKKSSKKTRPSTKEAWAAYRQLLKDNEDISDDTGSEISDIDIDNFEIDFSDQERKQREREVNEKLKKDFKIDKELTIKVEQADISEFDVGSLPRKDGKLSTKIDRLCDISNVLQKRKTTDKKKKLRRKSRRFSSSSDSDNDSLLSSSSNLSDDSAHTPQDTDSNRNSPCYLSDNAEQDKLANDLWDNIKNSSDESVAGWSSVEDSLSSSDDEEDLKKTKKEGGNKDKGGRKKKNKGSGSEAEEDNSGDDTGSDESDGNGDEDAIEDEEMKEKDIKKEDSDSSDDDDFVGVRKGRGAWRHDPLLKSCLTSDDESDFDSDKGKRKIRGSRTKRRPKQLDSDDESEPLDEERKGMKTPTKKTDNSSDSSDVEFIDSIERKKATPPKSIVIDEEADEDSPSKRGKGRRNIRALVEDDELAEATQQAKKEESERIKRLQEREKAKENFSQTQSFGSQPSEDETDPLILDVNEEIQVKVHPKITKKLKPHQRNGIQFMWDSCYESVEQLKQGYDGSGCILAHCMGLGKTLQALGLIHTVFNYVEVTKTRHVLVVCPLSTVSNWRNEFRLAFKDMRHCKLQLYTIEDKKMPAKRFQIVNRWWKNSGILVMGYEGFGNMTNHQKLDKWENQNICMKKDVLRALINPGPDLVICDEGHLLRNKQTQRNLALNQIKTKRRIILTGTPLQNNLLEYYVMVHFVKPNLLGTEREYKTNFVNPITNGQFEDSTAVDILIMKKRTHVLHKILNKTVQRVEDTVLKQYLPQLVDQALFVKLSDLQIGFYNTYLDSANARPVSFTAAGNINRNNFLPDTQMLRYICTHPDIVAIAKKNAKSKIKEQDVIEDNIDEAIEEKVLSTGDWYKNLIPTEGMKRSELGTKIMVVLGIVKEAAANDDKVLIFSQAHAEMDCLEYFLKQELQYKKRLDYNRMDGTISPSERTGMCDVFNNKNNKRLKVFIMSTKVGGLGLNLTAANRVILMNVSWNPSYDTQSVFRAFRFGQNKPVYVYRLIAIDTMEEKVYQRQVTKLAVAHRVVDKHQITRHYSAADIQEFYSVRPTTEGERPLPNVPEDRVLAKLVQKYQFLYRWHEHQALLANRPEEDLNEQQKNAAWEEFNKKAELPPPGLPPSQLRQNANVSNLLSQPGPSGTQPVPGHRATNPNTYISGFSAAAEHNYSLPKTNNIVPQRINSLDDFSTTTQPKYVPRPIFVDVKAPLGPRPNLSGINFTSVQKGRANVSKSEQNQSTSSTLATTQVRLGNGVTLTTQNNSPKIYPPPAHSQKPSISIIPQNVSPAHSQKQSTSTIAQASSMRTASNTKPPPFVPKKSNMVQNPLNLARNVPNVNLNQPTKGAIQIQKEKTLNQIKNDVNIVSNQTKTANSLPLTKYPLKVIVGPQKRVTEPPPRSTVPHLVPLPNKISVPPPLIRPVAPLTATTTTPTTNPLQTTTPTASTAPVQQQSPLQKHMRSFMEHLHQLQQSMKEREAMGISNLMDSNMGTVYNGNAQGALVNTNIGGTLNTNAPSTLNNKVGAITTVSNSLSPRVLVKVGPKPTFAPLLGGTSTTNVTGLNAARNLSNITRTYQKAQDKVISVTVPSTIPSTSQNSIPLPNVRLIGTLPTSAIGSNGFIPTSRVVISSNIGASMAQTNGNSSGTAQKIISSKSIAKQNNGSFPRIISGAEGNVRINPVGRINKNKVITVSPKGVANLKSSSAAGGNVSRIVPVLPGSKKIVISQKGNGLQNSGPLRLNKKSTVSLLAPLHSKSLLQKRMAANLNKLTGITTKKIPAAPQGSFNNGTNIRTYQAKKNNNTPSRSHSSPSLPISFPVSKSNKENRVRKRHHNNSGTSIDLSNDEECGNTSGGSLSQDMVNTLKKKGVSINYLGKGAEKDVISVD